MIRDARVRFWVECGLAALCAVLAISSVIWGNWIELLFEFEPDGGDGSFEWGFVVAFALAAVVFAVLARIEFHRLPAQSGRT